MASFVKDEKRGHDDVSGVLGRVRILSVKQAEVDDGVGVRPAHIQLKEDRKKYHTYSQ